MSIPWMYQLFLSVDLENSTKFKSVSFSSSNNEYPEWVEFFEDFYSTFADLFKNQLNTKKVAVPSIWKYMGDEIIYNVEIKNSAHVVDYVDCFKKAIATYNSSAEKQKDYKCHGTIWGAGFPVRNREVSIPTEISGRKKSTDFIGLDMDLGFRISKYSKAERLVVSLPVAYILSEHSYEGLRFYDFVDVKGIQKKYPLFWTCTEQEENPQTQWYQIHHASTVRDFCKNQFDDSGISEFSTPFIENDPSRKCSKICEQMKSYKEKIELAAETSKQERKQKGSSPKKQKGSSPKKQNQSSKKTLPLEWKKIINDSFK